MRNLAVVAALALTTPAWGAGIGTTVGVGTGAVVGLGYSLNADYPSTSMGFFPSFDLRLDPLIIQVHALETLVSLSNDEIFLGANAYYILARPSFQGGWEGVVAPGGGVDLFGNPFGLVVDAEVLFGIQYQGDIGVGVYVVPALGVLLGDVDTALVTGGTVQFSVWFGG
ncbi:MAG: hypothetical protein JRJ84_01335 [Deltaproteobacteria bacterium]|nr:hypothetical protein [Deltaproteobacteria bacterium]